MKKLQKPNFKNAAIKRRCRIALGFVLSTLKEHKAKPLHTREIDNHFTHQRNPISKYLRHMLLTTTSTHYDLADGKCKEYKLNRNGVDYIQYCLNNPDDPISYHRFLADIEDQTESPELKQFLAQPKEPREQKLIDLHIASHHAEELKSLTFHYDDKSFRYWNPIQNISSEIRADLLAKAGLKFKYDTVAAAPTLIYQQAKKYNPDLKCEFIEKYLENRSLVRHHLANETETEYDTIKQIINSLFAGAKLGYGEYFSISKILMHDEAKIIYLKDDDFTSGLRADIKNCWKAIRPHQPKQYRNGKLISFSSRDKWFVYFQLERMILDEVKRFINKTHNKIFLEHDGWTTKYVLDLNLLIDVIYQRTGFKIDIEATVH